MLLPLPVPSSPFYKERPASLSGGKRGWFSHDVTKNQTKKLPILPRFYFHDALEQLKTNFHTNFRFKSVLGFVIEKNNLFQEILLSKQFMH